MANVGLKELLQAGVHFGHQTSRWNPKMRRYIFAERSGIYLLDLKKTLRQLERAREAIRETVGKGGTVLFVCTKPQLAELVRGEAERCGAFHVTERWVGGLLTNFQTIRKNIRRLKELEQGLEEGHFDFYTKKEKILLDREREKLDRYLAGIKDMNGLPGLLYVVDAKREEIAVKEADRLEIPVVAIADTNADPDRLTIPIPGNDDAIRSVALITRVLADTVEAARREAPEEAARKAEAYTYSSDVGETEGAETDRPGRPRKKRPRRRPRPEVIARVRTGREEGEKAAPKAETAEAPEEEAPEEDAVTGSGASGEADDGGERPEGGVKSGPEASGGRATEAEAGERPEDAERAMKTGKPAGASVGGSTEEEEEPGDS